MEAFKRMKEIIQKKENSKLYQISIYELIDKARNLYLTKDCKGMCIAFEMILFRDYYIVDDKMQTKIIESIEKFNSEWLIGKKIPKCEFWWELDDIQSRIKAFDKLLTWYKEHPIVINLKP